MTIFPDDHTHAGSAASGIALLAMMVTGCTATAFPEPGPSPALSRYSHQCPDTPVAQMLNVMGSEPYRVVGQADFTPQFYVEMTERGRQRLQLHPCVVGIQQDLPDPPTGNRGSLSAPG